MPLSLGSIFLLSPAESRAIRRLQLGRRHSGVPAAPWKVPLGLCAAAHKPSPVVIPFGGNPSSVDPFPMFHVHRGPWVRFRFGQEIHLGVALVGDAIVGEKSGPRSVGVWEVHMKSARAVHADHHGSFIHPLQVLSQKISERCHFSLGFLRRFFHNFLPGFLFAKVQSNLFHIPFLFVITCLS